MSTVEEEQAREGVLRELFGEWDEGSLPGSLEGWEIEDPLPSLEGWDPIAYDEGEDWRPVSFEDTVDELLMEVADLIIDRQKTYGPRNIEQQGIFGIVNRIGNDKLARIRQRLHGSIVNGEIVLEDIDLGSVNEPGIINDLADVIGYAVCGILLLRDEWGRPLADES